MRLAAILAALLFATSAGAGKFEETKAKAEQGDAQSQSRLGLLYRLGAGGATQNYAEAMRWFHKSAEQGNESAQVSLGYAYLKGEIVTQDHVESVKWFQEAAEQDSTAAMHKLGEAYESGAGDIRRDYTLAVSWYRRGAEKGMLPAQISLANMYVRGYGVLQNFVIAHAWFNVASASDHALARDERDKLARTMTPAQIAEAQKLAAEFFEKYKAK